MKLKTISAKIKKYIFITDEGFTFHINYRRVEEAQDML